MWLILPKLVLEGRLSYSDAVVVGLCTVAPPVQDTKHDRLYFSGTLVFHTNPQKLVVNLLRDINMAQVLSNATAIVTLGDRDVR